MQKKCNFFASKKRRRNRTKSQRRRDETCAVVPVQLTAVCQMGNGERGNWREENEPEQVKNLRPSPSPRRVPNSPSPTSVRIYIRIRAQISNSPSSSASLSPSPPSRFPCPARSLRAPLPSVKEQPQFRQIRRSSSPDPCQVSLV